jgi:hypothetical protein
LNKNFTGTNALTYFAAALVTKKKSFTTVMPGMEATALFSLPLSF